MLVVRVIALGREKPLGYSPDERSFFLEEESKVSSVAFHRAIGLLLVLPELDTLLVARTTRQNAYLNIGFDPTPLWVLLLLKARPTSHFRKLTTTHARSLNSLTPIAGFFTRIPMVYST